MVNSFVNLIRFAAGIFCCLALGKAIAWLFGGLPASLYGMLFFCLVLHFGWLRPGPLFLWVQRSIAWMPIVFLPICIGVIEYGELLRTYGIQILAAGVAATLLTLSGVGLFSQYYLGRNTRRSTVSVSVHQSVNQSGVNQDALNQDALNQDALDQYSTAQHTSVDAQSDHHRKDPHSNE